MGVSEEVNTGFFVKLEVLLSLGTIDEIAAHIKHQLEKQKGPVGNDMLVTNATVLIEAVLNVLIARRDQNNEVFHVDKLTDALAFESILKLAADKKVSKQYRESLLNYMKSLPGFVKREGQGVDLARARKIHGCHVMVLEQILELH